MIKRFVGDVHGKFSQYKRILKESPYPTTQVGDLGVGFRKYGGPNHGEFNQNPPHKRMSEGGHRFIRGNHDNPHECTKHSQWIKDGTVEDDIMYMGGALSIDKEWRIPEFSWWEDEELSVVELNTMVDIYTAAKPRVMVTHDCPESIAHILFGINGKLKFEFPSRTRQALESMFNVTGHQPELWCFGHWHESRDTMFNKTRFVCLAELEYKDFDV